jgi:hypothetical protein
LVATFGKLAFSSATNSFLNVAVYTPIITTITALSKVFSALGHASIIAQLAVSNFFRSMKKDYSKDDALDFKEQVELEISRAKKEWKKLEDERQIALGRKKAPKESDEYNLTGNPPRHPAQM